MCHALWVVTFDLELFQVKLTIFAQLFVWSQSNLIKVSKLHVNVSISTVAYLVVLIHFFWCLIFFYTSLSFVLYFPFICSLFVLYFTFICSLLFLPLLYTSLLFVQYFSHICSILFLHLFYTSLLFVLYFSHICSILLLWD